MQCYNAVASMLAKKRGRGEAAQRKVAGRWRAETHLVDVPSRRCDQTSISNDEGKTANSSRIAKLMLLEGRNVALDFLCLCETTENLRILATSSLSDTDNHATTRLTKKSCCCNGRFGRPPRRYMSMTSCRERGNFVQNSGGMKSASGANVA